MKKTFILIGLCVAVSAFGQVAFNSFTTNTQSSAVVVSIVTTNLPLIAFTGSDALVVGQQLGSMTNAAGQLLFTAGAYTNHNSTITFTVNDFGQVVPSSIAVSGQISK